MPQSKHLKGLVTYYTIAMYFVEFSLITKSKWERNIVRSKIAIHREVAMKTDGQDGSYGQRRMYFFLH